MTSRKPEDEDEVEPIYEITDGRLVATFDGEAFAVRVVNGSAKVEEIRVVETLLGLSLSLVKDLFRGPQNGDPWSFLCDGVAAGMGWFFIAPDLGEDDDDNEGEGARVY